jgi:3-oxoacyl-[acyl-carrier-protein] synthase III
MAYGVETLYTSRNTEIELEVHKNPSKSINGVVAHWGERILDADLKDRISEAFPGVKLEDDTGFEKIWHQKYGTTREQGIQDEIEVAKLVGEKTMEANGWEAKDIAGLVMGSGVPIVDSPKYPNYANAVAQELRLNKNTYLHETFAACASGGIELINVLKDPELKGKPILVMGMEGITYLTQDFDPEISDALFMRFFSNGAAGIGVVPNENMTLLTSAHKEVEDKKGTLRAKMTYEHLLNPEGNIWQDVERTSLMKIPKPISKQRGEMQGARTAQFFYSNGVDAISPLYENHKNLYPDFHVDYGVAHHPSKATHEHLLRKLKESGIEVNFPWVVNDGNSSAATTLIAEIRQLNMAKEGTVRLLATYGAGGSFNAATILNAEKPHFLEQK